MPKIVPNVLEFREVLKEKADKMYPDKTAFSIRELAKISGVPEKTIYNNKSKYPIHGKVSIFTFARMLGG